MPTTITEYMLEQYKASMRYWRLKHIKRAAHIYRTLGRKAAFGLLRNNGIILDNECRRLLTLSVQLSATKSFN